MKYRESIDNDDGIIADQNIIYFGPEKWDGMWRNRHQLMTRFARYNKVIYVEPVKGLRWLIENFKQRNLTKQSLLENTPNKRVTEVDNNLFIYKNPDYIPISGRYPLDRITWSAWLLRLKYTLRQLRFKRPIIWLSRPSMGNLIGCFEEKMSIYHVVDEYSAYTQLDYEKQLRIKNIEKELMKSVDMVIVVSKNLYESKRVYNDHTYLVSNGVDFDRYDKALKDEKIFSDIEHLQKPVIGYSGLISSRLNLDLVYTIARGQPEWNFVLIGAVDDRGCEYEIEKLKKMVNIHFLGLKNIIDVPYYVKAFDVCIVPYANNKETINLSPLKLYDYLAMGKPIVTSNFPAAREFKKFLYVAQNSQSFSKLIKIGLDEEKNSTRCRARKKIASLNTWDKRVSQLSSLIKSHL